MNIGDKINDCYMNGISSLENIGNSGYIEAMGKDWVIVRDTYQNKPILVTQDSFDILRDNITSTLSSSS